MFHNRVYSCLFWSIRVYSCVISILCSISYYSCLFRVYNVSIHIYSCLFVLRVYNASSAYQRNQCFQKQIINTRRQIEMLCFTMVSGHDYKHYPVSTRGECGRLRAGVDGSGGVDGSAWVWTARCSAPAFSCAGFMFGCWVHVWVLGSCLESVLGSC